MSTTSNSEGFTEDEIDAISLYNSDKPIFAFMITSGGSIGPSKLGKQSGDSV